MEAVNGVSEADKGGPTAPSPLTGCYLLIVVGEPHSQEHKDIILRRIAKGLLSWDSSSCYIDLEKELTIISQQAPEGEDARYGERLIQFASENLVTEILIHPAISTLSQCMKNLLSSFTRHRHIIHSGYTFAANGSWILQDGTFSYIDFSEAFQEIEVQRILRAYDNSISLDIHCSPEGDWTRLPKEVFTKNCKVRVNPDDVLTSGSPPIVNFLNYISPFLIPTDIETLLESSDVVGNIRFSHPTLYVFPGGQGDAALFGINGFNMLVDGGFARKSCFWDFVRHLDRLDAVLLTRLNNSNVNGISSVLRRKRFNTVYPQIGHFFCNIQERRALLSPDGDKDKDPLLINLLEEGHDLISNLKQLNLQPQTCYRDNDPINLYHKVGHGTLDMYILSPSKDSKEVKEFIQKWNNNDSKLFVNQRGTKEFSFPLPNLVSISALLVWQPANSNDSITRILFPGSTPQNKIFEGLDKMKQLDCLKYPICSAKSLSPNLKSKLLKVDKLNQEQKDTKQKEQKSYDVKTKAEDKVVEENTKNGHTNGFSGENVVTKVIKKHDSTESEKSGPKSIEHKKLEDKKILSDKTAEDKGRVKTKTETKSRTESRSLKQSRSIERKPKSTIEKKSSPTTPKKTVESKLNGDAIKPKTRLSPISTPAKSTKEANNRKVVESKNKVYSKKESIKSEKRDIKERKPISKKPSESSPIRKVFESPIKKPGDLHKIDLKRPKFEKEGTTDSSTVSTPSADIDTSIKKDLSKLTPEELEQLKARELAELKEEQEVVNEIEAVFRKSEKTSPTDADLRKIQNISVDDKTEGEEYLIIEKEVIEQDSLDEKEAKESETQKHLRDSEESEKQRKLSDEKIVEAKILSEEKTAEKVSSTEEKQDVTKDLSIVSPEEKVDVSSAKKFADRDIEDENKDTNVLESQPDEKYSTPIESGATTAPTLPEDERIPLDEIKEDIIDQVIVEKHVKEETKEKEIPVVQLPPTAAESINKLPSVVGIRLDKQAHIRDIVKTPDEVADLPVHEVVDSDNYDHYNQHEVLKVEEKKIVSVSKTEIKKLVTEENHDAVNVVESNTENDIVKNDEIKDITGETEIKETSKPIEDTTEEKHEKEHKDFQILEKSKPSEENVEIKQEKDTKDIHIVEKSTDKVLEDSIDTQKNLVSDTVASNVVADKESTEHVIEKNVIIQDSITSKKIETIEKPVDITIDQKYNIPDASNIQKKELIQEVESSIEDLKPSETKTIESHKTSPEEHVSQDALDTKATDELEKPSEQLELKDTIREQRIQTIETATEPLSNEIAQSKEEVTKLITTTNTEDAKGEIENKIKDKDEPQEKEISKTEEQLLAESVISNISSEQITITKEQEDIITSDTLILPEKLPEICKDDRTVVDDLSKDVKEGTIDFDNKYDDKEVDNTKEQSSKEIIFDKDDEEKDVDTKEKVVIKEEVITSDLKKEEHVIKDLKTTKVSSKLENQDIEGIIEVNTDSETDRKETILEENNKIVTQEKTDDKKDVETKKEAILEENKTATKEKTGDKEDLETKKEAILEESKTATKEKTDAKEDLETKKEAVLEECKTAAKEKPDEKEDLETKKDAVPEESKTAAKEKPDDKKDFETKKEAIVEENETATNEKTDVKEDLETKKEAILEEIKTATKEKTGVKEDLETKKEAILEESKTATKEKTDVKEDLETKEEAILEESKTATKEKTDDKEDLEAKKEAILEEIKTTTKEKTDDKEHLETKKEAILEESKTAIKEKIDDAETKKEAILEESKTTAKEKTDEKDDLETKKEAVPEECKTASKEKPDDKKDLETKKEAILEDSKSATKEKEDDKEDLETKKEAILEESKTATEEKTNDTKNLDNKKDAILEESKTTTIEETEEKKDDTIQKEAISLEDQKLITQETSSKTELPLEESKPSLTEEVDDQDETKKNLSTDKNIVKSLSEITKIGEQKLAQDQIKPLELSDDDVLDKVETTKIISETQMTEKKTTSIKTDTQDYAKAKNEEKIEISSTKLEAKVVSDATELSKEITTTTQEIKEDRRDENKLIKLDADEPEKDVQQEKLDVKQEDIKIDETKIETSTIDFDKSEFQQDEEKPIKDIKTTSCRVTESHIEIPVDAKTNIDEDITEGKQTEKDLKIEDTHHLEQISKEDADQLISEKIEKDSSIKNDIQSDTEIVPKISSTIDKKIEYSEDTNKITSEKALDDIKNEKSEGDNKSDDTKHLESGNVHVTEVISHNVISELKSIKEIDETSSTATGDQNIDLDQNDKIKPEVLKETSLLDTKDSSKFTSAKDEIIDSNDILETKTTILQDSKEIEEKVDQILEAAAKTKDNIDLLYDKLTLEANLECKKIDKDTSDKKNDEENTKTTDKSINKLIEEEVILDKSSKNVLQDSDIAKDVIIKEDGKLEISVDSNKMDTSLPKTTEPLLPKIDDESKKSVITEEQLKDETSSDSRQIVVTLPMTTDSLLKEINNETVKVSAEQDHFKNESLVDATLPIPADSVLKGSEHVTEKDMIKKEPIKITSSIDSNNLGATLPVTVDMILKDDIENEVEKEVIKTEKINTETSADPKKIDNSVPKTAEPLLKESEGDSKTNLIKKEEIKVESLVDSKEIVTALPVTTDSLVKEIEYKSNGEDKIIQEKIETESDAMKTEKAVPDTLLDKSKTETKEDVPKNIEVKVETTVDIAKIDTTLSVTTESQKEQLSEKEILNKILEDNKEIHEIETKLQKLEESVKVIPPVVEKQSDQKVLGDIEIIDKLDLGRKSPKEREQDVAKIVASVAEVLKSDAPLEEFEGKIPLEVTSYAYPFSTELRETHITTVDSPIYDKNISDGLHIIEEEVSKDPTSSFLLEEKKISSIHADYDEKSSTESRATTLIKDSAEFLQETAKIISDIKQTSKSESVSNEYESKPQEFKPSSTTTTSQSSSNIETKQLLDDKSLETVKSQTILISDAKDIQKMSTVDKIGDSEVKSPVSSRKSTPEPISKDSLEVNKSLPVSGKSTPDIKDSLSPNKTPIMSRSSTPSIVIEEEKDDFPETFDKKEFESTSEVISNVKTNQETNNDKIIASQTESDKKTKIDAKTEKDDILDITKDFILTELSKQSIAKSCDDSAKKVSEEINKHDIVDLQDYKTANLSGSSNKQDSKETVSGKTTPPTAPVSPIIRVQSGTISDVIKDTTFDTGKERMIDDEDDKESSDEDIPGSPLSVTSQIAHSTSSQYDNEDSVRGTAPVDPMNVSYYGGFPDDFAEPAKTVQSKDDVDDSQPLSSTDFTEVKPEGSPSHVYSVTTAKYCSSKTLEKVETLEPQSSASSLMTSSFIGSELPTEKEDDPIASWGKPLGLPSPAPLNDNKGTPKKERKIPSNVIAKNKLNEDKKTVDSKFDKRGRKICPIYVDLTYVPHHGNSNYSYIDFFKRIRARYYVFSGIEPSKEVYNALLEAKQTWDDKELEVTIISTYDTDVLGYWVAENEDLLAKYKIDLSPSASRCTINLQDHETSCSAYRLEFS